MVQCLNDQGLPIANQKVKIQLIRHDFFFGTCVVAGMLTSQSENAQRYREWILKHCNAIVDENTMKWYATEKIKGKWITRRPTSWPSLPRENNLMLRGHCLFWSKDKFNEPWVKELSPPDLRKHVLQRTEEIVARYRFSRLLGQHQRDVGWRFFHRQDPQLRADVFKTAAKVAPESPIYINEYGILGSQEKLDRYMDLARSFPEVGGLGIQEHACERFTTALLAGGAKDPERAHQYSITPERAWEDLDQLQTLNLPIHLTEVTARHPDPAVRAAGLETLLRVAYAHPAVDGLWLWGFGKGPIGRKRGQLGFQGLERRSRSPTPEPTLERGVGCEFGSGNRSQGQGPFFRSPRNLPHLHGIPIGRGSPQQKLPRDDPGVALNLSRGL